MLIYALGSISGANFNPAATFALLLAGATDRQTAIAYMATQVLAAIPTGESS